MITRMVLVSVTVPRGSNRFDRAGHADLQVVHAPVPDQRNDPTTAPQQLCNWR
jgi:hypothetical protein